MPEFTGNNPYLTIDGQDCGAVWRTVTITPGGAQIDTTSGAGVEHMTRQPGLNDHSITIELAYDTDNVHIYLPLLKQNVTRRIIYGPEQNRSGKPKHEQDFIFAGPPVQQARTKDLVVLNTTGVAANPPVSDMYDGATF